MTRGIWLLGLSLACATAAAAGRETDTLGARRLRPATPSGLEQRREAPVDAAELAAPQAAAKASVNSKYRKLLAVIRVPDDLASYADFNDYGQSTTESWGGYSGLPTGYWVYVYPHWYIWGEASEAADPAPALAADKRSWGPEQALGEPDTTEAGDIVTAWASASEDDQDEWLQLEYGAPIRAVAVIVHESYNPGALSRITMVRPDTEEVDLWRGEDPTPASRDHGVSIITLKEPVEASKIRLYLASTKVPGWNEIDAVGLIDSIGKTHWATGATASSTFADR